MSKPTATIEVVTPETAKKWLDRNRRNRKVNSRRIAFYLDQMKRGTWQFVGDSIRFDTNGDLADGQHRLLALIEYGRSLEMVVVRGLKPEAFHVIDTGKSRSAGDVISILGNANATTMAATTKTIIMFKQGRYSNKDQIIRGVSNTEVVNFVKKHPALDEIVSYSMALWYQFRAIPSSALAALYFIISAKDEKKAEVFFSKYASGANLTEGSPIRSLRNRLIQDTNNQSQLTRRDKMALFIHAWNAYYRGRELENVRVRGEYSFPKPIPE